MAKSRTTVMFLDGFSKQYDLALRGKEEMLRTFEEALDNDEKWCRMPSRDGTYSIFNLRLVREIRIEDLDD